VLSLVASSFSYDETVIRVCVYGRSLVRDGCGFSHASERRVTCAFMRTNKYIHTNAFQNEKHKIYGVASNSAGVRCDELHRRY